MSQNGKHLHIAGMFRFTKFGTNKSQFGVQNIGLHEKMKNVPEAPVGGLFKDEGPSLNPEG
jgi:hypothetical protein